MGLLTSGLRWITRGAVGLAVVGAALGVVAGVRYHTDVVVSPGPAFEASAIWSVVADESPVFFRDGTTRVGVFFDGEHRAFVGWDGLPAAWVASIVAAEDDGFWTHAGIAPEHLLRAFRDNLLAGRMVAGGSTLTQQTAKNLFYRPDRSIASKVDEALAALRLEAHFSKHEILTFYANQFHVSGNGRGLGIGARYFFDREVGELGLLECAFLAGMVKAPSTYDPFRADPAAAARARAKSVERTRYVLRRLAAESAERLVGPEPFPGGPAAHARRVAEVRALQAEARAHLAAGFDLPFRKGTFRYESSALLDEVGRRLAGVPFDSALGRAGVTDPARAGLEVVTTLEVEAQRAATYALWHHLTEAGTMLEGLGLDAFVRASGDPGGPGLVRPLRPAEFRVGTVVAPEAGDPALSLRLAVGGLPCLVDERGLRRVADALRRGAVRQAGARASDRDVRAVRDGLPPGTHVSASVRAVSSDGSRCDLEARPALQGAVVVLDGGRLLALVSGNDNKDFNRATAPRQLGSAWKPLVFHAALELGWLPDDLLDNRRQPFRFSTTTYTPRADHDAAAEVTMGRASAASENLASVWLAYHLLDRVDAVRTAELAEALGLARRADEADAAFARRIQELGVLPTPERVREALFLRARHTVTERALAEGRRADAAALSSVVFGWGLAEGEAGLASDRAPTWDAVRAAAEGCREDWSRVRSDLALGLPSEPGRLAPMAGGAGGPGVACGSVDGVGDAPAWSSTVSLPEADDLRVAGRWRLADVEALAVEVEQRALARELQGDAAPGLYDPELLHWHQDFRVALGLRYLARLARRYGVQTPIREVLSLPLGASEITLEEAARLYEGLTTGHAARFPGWDLGRAPLPQPPSSTALVERLRDVGGRTLYLLDPARDRVASDATAAMTTDLLRLVVDEGTGRRARGAVSVPGASASPLPVVGKTGTTNSFRNAAFVGAVPVVEDGRIVRPIVIAVYVGYDDNRPLTRGGISLAGASGALPAWLGTAHGLAAAGLLGRGPAGEQGWAWPAPAELVRVPLDGGPPAEPVEGGAPPSAATVLTRPAGPPADAELEWLGTPDAAPRIAPEPGAAPPGWPWTSSAAGADDEQAPQ